MAKAQDAMKVGKAYRLLMENDRVRVLDIRLRPGEIEPMHNHPDDHIVYVLKDTKWKLTSPDGKAQVIDLKAGQVVWMEADTHSAENIGTTEGHNLVVEIKKR
jgi:quercetin dioxygenase-like cupin family protein